jgi:hypothetical protein
VLFLVHCAFPFLGPRRSSIVSAKCLQRVCAVARRRFEVEALLFRGRPDVVDADLADYFGSIPHSELPKSVARRIVDRRVLHLIKMWLESPVEETDDRGRKTRTTAARDNRRGIPQGSPLTALFKDALLFQRLLDPFFPGTVGNHLTDRTRESAGASQVRCICYRKKIAARALTHALVQITSDPRRLVGVYCADLPPSAVLWPHPCR